MEALHVHDHNNSLSNDEPSFSPSNDSHEETIHVVDDEQYRLFLEGHPIIVEDQVNNGFELFVQKEGFNQIMSLILKEYTNNVFFGEVSDSNNFEDWMKFIEGDEDHENKQFIFAKFSHISYVFQLNTKMVALDGDLTFKKPNKEKDRWAKIKSKIRIDPDLGRNKTTQLWEILEQFPNFLPSIKESWDVLSLESMWLKIKASLLV